MSESAIAQLLSAHHSSRDKEKARNHRPCSKYIGTSLSPGSRRSIRPGASTCIHIEVHEPSPDSRWSAITPRQFEVLACLVEGRPTKTICKMLDMSPGTAKIHISALLRALKARNRAEAVIAALKLGWIRPIYTSH